MITQPYVNFIQPDAGGNVKPVSKGKVYIGNEGLDQKLGGNPIYYRDNEGVEKEIPNPIYLNMTGVAVAGPNSSDIINPYTKKPNSILIEDKNGDEVYSSLFDFSNDITTKTLGDYAQIVYESSVGFSAVQNLVAGNPISAFDGNAVKTIDNGFGLDWSISKTEAPDRYNVQLDNGLFAVLNSQDVELKGLGVNSGDDISQLIGKLLEAENVRKVKSSGLDSVEMSIVKEIKRDDVLVKLPKLTWKGDYDLYDGGISNRQVGIFTATGTRSDVAMNVTSTIFEGDSTYTLDSTNGLSEGGFAVMLGGAKFNYLTRITKIDGNKVTLDYTAGWDELENTVRIYSCKPVKNVHIIIDEIVDESGSTIPEHQVTGVTFLDSFGGSLRVGNASSMANPVCLTRRAHTLYIPYMDNQNPRYTDSGRGYTLQMNGSLFCSTGLIKGTKVRHSIDWTRCAYCTSDVIHGIETAGIAVTTHGVYEHDITVNEIITSKGCSGTLALANAGAKFGERTKRFKVVKKIIINGQLDIQNAEDIEINGAVLIESDFVRINADSVLNNCDFKACTSFRIRSRDDREQLSVVMNGGSYPNVELQNFTGTIRADNAVMRWFKNQDTSKVPKSIKTENCVHNIEDPITLTLSETLSLSNAAIRVPASSSSIGVIAECPKLIISSADCENSPVISHDSSVAKSMIIRGLVDIDPNAARTAAIIRARNVNGLVANISGVVSEYSGSGKILEFGRSGNSNITLLMSNNYLNGDLEITSFGSVVKSTITGNIVKDLSNLPSNDGNNGVVANIQI